MKFRFWIALWMAKLSIPALKITKHNGTNFPGKLALKICPDFLKYVNKPKRIITVTGTNGKTTVSNMTCDILEKMGFKVLNNRYGSNINSGISTSLLTGVNLFNKAKFDIAVLEVDERSSKRIYPYVQPDFTVITNLFRDSIMRNAHPGYIADFLTANIPAKTKLILNADDLISSRVAPNNDRVYFGITRMDTDIDKCINLINDVQICPECGGQLKWDYVRYHHIGRAHCTECEFGSPDYDYTASDVNLTDMTVVVTDKSGSMQYPLPSDSTFNAYNVVTEVALLRELGYTHEEIRPLFDDLKITSSRYLCEDTGNVRVIMQMAKEKNALACSRAFDYVTTRSGEKELFLMMNCLSDVKHWSENTCWLYDCDFEFLAREGVTHIVATGPRSIDYRLRLLLAGVPEEMIDCVEDEFEAVDKLHFKPGSDIYMFYGTDSLTLAFKVREKVLAKAKEAK